MIDTKYTAIIKINNKYYSFDCYDTCYEEGDDYYKGVSGIPGMDAYHKQFAKPTHWMEMPTHP